MPKSRLDFWRPKLEANRLRDLRIRQQLEAQGWSVIEVWECELSEHNLQELALKLQRMPTTKTP
jgi:DNA mismatch endonuclease (patch repair protein)